MPPAVCAAVERFQIEANGQIHPDGIGQINSSADVINPDGWLTNERHIVGRLDDLSTDGELLWVGHRLGFVLVSFGRCGTFRSPWKFLICFLWTCDEEERPRLTLYQPRAPALHPLPLGFWCRQSPSTDLLLAESKRRRCYVVRDGRYGDRTCDNLLVREVLYR